MKIFKGLFTDPIVKKFIIGIILFVVGAFFLTGENNIKDIKNSIPKNFNEAVETANKIKENVEKGTIDIYEGLTEEKEGELNKSDVVETKGFGSYNGTEKNELSFSKSKKLLMKDVYNEDNVRIDNYCGCDFNERKAINRDSCGFKPYKNDTVRSNRIEFEHIVPAENFGRWFKEWREGNPEKCGDSKGRRCAGTNEKFAEMEGDPYNLIPVNGEVNMYRSNLKYGEVKGSKFKSFGSCKFKVDSENKIAEPQDFSKGMIARSTLYFAIKYKNNFKLSDKQLKLYEKWNKQFPVNGYECKINEKKEKLVGYPNIVTKKACIQAGYSK